MLNLALVCYWSCCSSGFYVSTRKGGEVAEHMQASKYNLLQIKVTSSDFDTFWWLIRQYLRAKLTGCFGIGMGFGRSWNKMPFLYLELILSSLLKTI